MRAIIYLGLDDAGEEGQIQAADRKPTGLEPPFAILDEFGDYARPIRIGKTRQLMDPAPREDDSEKHSP